MKKKEEKKQQARVCFTCRNIKALWKESQPCKRCWCGSNWKEKMPKAKEISLDKA